MKKRIFIILVFLFVVSLLSFIPQGIQAGGECTANVCTNGSGGLVPCGRDCDDPNTGYNETCPCQLCHFFVMMDRILDFIFLILVPTVAVLMLVIGGIMFFFAGGSPQRLESAKSIITSTITGLVIIFTAWVIINTFFIIIGVNTWTGLESGWFTIDCAVD
ncbi:hypothetical protein IH779_00400 [Patescibacteria group bacterium]|nr:hypothetical protein [Patescibacteria group bacterium]